MNQYNELSVSSGPGRVGGQATERSYPSTTHAPRRRIPDAQPSGTLPEQVQTLFNRIKADKENINQAAGEIRSLGEARELVRRAGNALDNIVKSFPPYPPGSMEREAFLNSVAGIRAMIERLTFPPGADGGGVRDVLSGRAFTDPAASDEELALGLRRINEEVEQLARDQVHLAAQVLPSKPEGSEESFLAESRGVGRSLLETRQSIGRDTRGLLEMIA
ncbi:MAG: hypothetical protein AB1899_17385 [Pseudomonadota bacterium]